MEQTFDRTISGADSPHRNSNAGMTTRAGNPHGLNALFSEINALDDTLGVLASQLEKLHSENLGLPPTPDQSDDAKHSGHAISGRISEATARIATLRRKVCRFQAGVEFMLEQTQ